MVRCILTALCVVTFSAAAPAQPQTQDRTESPLPPDLAVARLTDGSRIYLRLQEEEFVFTTSYGPLKIRMTDVAKIEFGPRIPLEAAKEIDQAVAALGTEEAASAWAILERAGEWAYPAYSQLARHADPAIAQKAAAALVRLRKAGDAKRLNRIGRDLVWTADSVMSGRIETPAWRVVTPHFGTIHLKVDSLASLRLGETDEPEEIPVNVQPDPGTLSNLGGNIGQVYYFRVTGANTGSVWGSDVYTTDSMLATAAVHAGALKMGETGIVKVTILAGQNAYAGSSRNGIQTSAYGEYHGSYRVSRAGRPKDD